MKGRKIGKAGSPGPAAGDKDWKHEKTPEERNDAPKIMAAAKKRKRGGKVDGDKTPPHAGRSPRKSGGRVGSNASPFSSARTGTEPPGLKQSGGNK